MFNGNKKISSCQMYKCFFCVSVCPSLFLFLYNYANPYDFVISYTLTFVFSLLFLSILKILGNRAINLSGFFSLLFIVKYILMIYFDLSIIFFTLYNCFGIPSTNCLFLLVIFILCLYIGKSGIEKIFRMSEILFIILIIPIIVLLFTPVFRINTLNLHSAFSYVYHPFISGNVIFRSFITSIVIFPEEICITLKKHFSSMDDSDSYVKSTLKSIITIFSIILGAALVIIGIYGNISNEYNIHPLFCLMQIMSIGQTMSVRLDFIFYIFIFASLLYAIGFYLYLINHCIKNIALKMKYGIFAFPMLSVIFIYLIFTPYKTANPLYERESTPAIVDNIYIENENIIFEIHEYSGENTFFNTHSNNIFHANQVYQAVFENSLDFSHVNAIYVPGNIYENNDILRKTLLQFKKQLIFPETLKIKSKDNTNYKYLYSIYTFNH